MIKSSNNPKSFFLKYYFEISVVISVASVIFSTYQQVTVHRQIYSIFLNQPILPGVLNHNPEFKKRNFSEHNLKIRHAKGVEILNKLCQENDIEKTELFCAYHQNNNLLHEKFPFSWAVSRGICPKPYIVVNPEALLFLDDCELEGLLAHELSHIKNDDTLKYFSFDFISKALAISSIIPIKNALITYWTPITATIFSMSPVQSIITLFSLVISSSYLVGTTLDIAVFKLRRNIEYRADTESAKFCKTPDNMISFLRSTFKIEPNLEVRSTHPSHENRILNLIMIPKVEQQKTSC